MLSPDIPMTACDLSLLIITANLQSVLILLFRGHAAADMALGLIHIQNHPGPGRKGWIDILQTVRDIFMYRRFAYPKFLRRLPYRGIVVYDVIGDGYRTFFDIFLQNESPEDVFYIICMEKQD